MMQSGKLDFRTAATLASLLGLLAMGSPATARAATGDVPNLGGGVNQSALHFFADGGTGIDRVMIVCDDVGGGPDASEPCDVGQGSFTVEVWVKGTVANNPTSNGGGDVQYGSFNWIDGNIIVDRDVWGTAGVACDRDWGLSLAGGLVRWGTGTAAGVNSDTTIEGSVNVLDGSWHHITAVRDTADGRLHIYVDGVLDFSSNAGVSTGDLSHPNSGCSLAQDTTADDLGPEIHLGGEKHGANLIPTAGDISYYGEMDEFRLWNVARSAAQIAQDWNQVVSPSATGLVGYWRFEEGSGATVADSSAAGSPSGVLDNGTPGRGEWIVEDGSSPGVQSSGQERCIYQMNLRGGQLGKQQNKEDLRCARLYQLERPEKLGNPATAQSCQTNDVRGRIQRQLDRLSGQHESHCMVVGEMPEFGFSSLQAHSDANRDEPLSLSADLFGADLDAALELQSVDRDAARCQQIVLDRAGKLYARLWTEARRGIRDAVKGTGQLPVTNEGELTAAITTTLLTDPSGRIARVTNKLADGFDKRCGALVGQVPALFPGACSASGSALAQCAAEWTRCRFCRSLNAADSLTLDCDAFDGGAGVCP